MSKFKTTQCADRRHYSDKKVCYIRGLLIVAGERLLSLKLEVHVRDQVPPASNQSIRFLIGLVTVVDGCGNKELRSCFAIFGRTSLR